LAQALEVMHPTGVYVQKPTGMAYPESVGNFRRVSIIRYAPDDSDESAGYNRYVPLKEIVATVYVFPSPTLRSFGSPRSVIEDARNHLCTDQFGAVKKEVTGAHPDAVLLQEGVAGLVQANVKHDGHFAAYKLTNSKFAGRENVLLRSDVDVFCYVGGKWTVEYRIDYPLDYEAAAEVADFMQHLIWTIPPEPGN
jgi:hypothetical protein